MSNDRPFRSIRRHLLILATAVLVPVLAFWSYTLYRQTELETQARVEGVQAIARANVGSADYIVNDLQTLMVRLAARPEFSALKADSCPIDFLGTLAVSPRVVAVWSRSAEGRVCGDLPRVFGGGVVSLPAIGQGDPADGIHGSVFNDKAAGDPIVVLESPIEDGQGRWIGAVGIAFTLPVSVRSTVPKATGAVDVVQGVIDERTGALNGIVGHVFVGRLPNLDPVERLYAREKIPGTPLWIVAGLPVSVVEASTSLDVLRGAGLLAGVVVVVFGGLAWLARRLVRPLEAIGEVALSVGQGRLKARVALEDVGGIREIATVSYRINTMIDKLEAERQEKVNSGLQYKRLFEQVMIGFVLYDATYDANGEVYDFRYRFVNSAFEHLTGLSGAEIAGKTLRMVRPHDAPRWFERLKPVMETGSPDVFIEHSQAVNSFYEIRAFRPALGQLALVFSDATERTLARQSLERMADRIAQATEASGIGIWEVSVDAALIDCDSQFRRLFGVDEAEGADRDSARANAWLTAIHPDDRQAVEAEWKAAVAGGRDFVSEFRVLDASGSSRVVKAHGSPRHDEMGRIDRVVGTVWDVTESREALARMEEARIAAETANSSKTRFLQTMSHELRTPLNAIEGFAQLLADSEGQPARRDYLDIICRSSEDLLYMIEDMLELTRIESGRIRLVSEPFDLGREMEAIRRICLVKAERKGLSVSTEIDGGLPNELRGDVRYLRQVLMNLIGNAIKFTKQGGVRILVDRVVVEEPSPDRIRVRFEVQDTGIGISPKNQDRIFEIFEQEDNSMTRRYGGPGLGLAISKRLVTRMGGVIGVSSEPGVGSRFHFVVDFGTGQPVPADDTTFSVTTPLPRLSVNNRWK